MTDIFISYSAEDRAFAERLVAALEEHHPDWSIWWDREIAPGRKFADVIAEELKQARCVIVIWSRASVVSDWVQAEADQGRKRDVLIPVLIDAATVPMPFDRIQTVSLKGWSGGPSHAGFRQLVKSITTVLETEVHLPPPESGFWAKLTGSGLGAKHAIAGLFGLALLGGGFLALWNLGLFDGTPEGMVQIPGGTFLMGSTPDEVKKAYEDALKTDPNLPIDWKWRERPDHLVHVDPFYIDINEVTVDQYRRYRERAGTATTRSDSSFASKYPQTAITWQEANDYCRHMGKRLPTEAEWEKAARRIETLAETEKAERGDTRTIYPWGNDPVEGSRANFCDVNCPAEHGDPTLDDGYRLAAPVGSFPKGASAVGVNDLAGNVAEWVQDWYDRDFYSGRGSTDEEERRVNPVNDSEPAERLRSVRGGHYLSGAAELRGAYRVGLDPAAKKEYVGFRCAKGAL